MQSSFPDGSEEHSMINMSLARIMYGTNDDVHAYSMSPGAFSARTGQTAYDISEKNSSAVPGHSALSGMLRRAWTALTKA
jgi:hypothetical protein